MITLMTLLTSAMKGARYSTVNIPANKKESGAIPQNDIERV